MIRQAIRKLLLTLGLTSQEAHPSKSSFLPVRSGRVSPQQLALPYQGSKTQAREMRMNRPSAWRRRRDLAQSEV